MGSVRAGEQIRLISSAFLHADIAHFFQYDYAFFRSSGDWLFGWLSFVIVYFESLVCGSLLTILFHKDDYNYRAVGVWGKQEFYIGDIIAAG
jgi:membrane associated rhomboid family serine protease